MAIALSVGGAGSVSEPGERVDPRESARAVGLRYTSDAQPGIRRKRQGNSFVYVDQNGSQIADEQSLLRIKHLAIPPAWTDVWICPNPRGHLQATGKDARGRKQYRYHPKWREIRDALKYDRMLEFAAALPKIRERVDQDMRLPGLPRNKVLATVVALLEQTRIRIGNDEYARENKSFGLTTLRDKHARIEGSTIRFEFRGKSGKTHQVELRDKRLARIVRACRDLPGQELFQYYDEDGTRQDVDSDDVNGYLREVSGGDFTAKDFRTWAGTVLAYGELCDCEPCTSEREAKQTVTRAVETVAAALGNTPAVCRKAYIHPAVVNAYTTGALEPNSPQRLAARRKKPASPFALSPEEECVVRLLQSLSAGAEKAA